LIRGFAEKEVEPQAAAHDLAESFNLPLFRRVGELGGLGIPGRIVRSQEPKEPQTSVGKVEDRYCRIPWATMPA